MSLPTFKRLRVQLQRYPRRIRAGVEWALLSQTAVARHPQLSVSLCTAVRNRFEHLQATFLQNVQDNLDHPCCEHVLLNYNCPDPRTDAWAREQLAPYIASGRVSYYLLPDVQKYSHAHTKNLTARLAKGDIVCCVDGDNFTGRGFARYLSAKLARPGVFLRGGGLGVAGFGGRIALRRSDWEAVGGYDEHFAGWGGEDMDFCDRLLRLGLRRQHIALMRFARVIDHGEEARVAGMSEDEADKKQTQVSNWHRRQDNAQSAELRVNGEAFGRGRVLKNFSEWLDA